MAAAVMGPEHGGQSLSQRDNGLPRDIRRQPGSTSGNSTVLEGTASAEAQRQGRHGQGWHEGRGRVVQGVGGLQPGGPAEPGQGHIPAHQGPREL